MTASRWTLVTSGQVASMVCSARRCGVRVDGRRDAVGGEDRRRALRDRVVELVDEDRAALAQLLDDVLVVDDLLAHVDRRAVELERALDGLHGAVHPGAVSARGSQEKPLDGRGHCADCRRIPARLRDLADLRTARADQLDDRLAHRVDAALRELVELSSACAVQG